MTVYVMSAITLMLFCPQRNRFRSLKLGTLLNPRDYVSGGSVIAQNLYFDAANDAYYLANCTGPSGKCYCSTCALVNLRSLLENHVA